MDKSGHGNGSQNVQLEQNPPPAYVWPVSEIVAYLDKHGATVIYANGSASIQFPPEVPAWVKARVTPHLRARRGEVLNYYYPPEAQFTPDPPAPPAPVEAPEAARKRLISEAIKRGIAAHKRVYYLKRNGHAVLGSEPPFRRHYGNGRRLGGEWRYKVVIPLEREATHVQVEGDSWVALPKVTQEWEDVELAPKVKRGK